MSRGISRDDVPPLVIEGMRRAAKNWDALHGTWADKAPEYWFTVHVALALQKGLHREKNWIKLEGNVANTLSACGPSRPGRPPAALRKNGRCDIVIERANETPFALVEVKSRAYSFSAAIASDVARLHHALRHKSKLEVACLALYSSIFVKRTQLSARKALEDKFSTNLERAKQICASDLNVTQFEPKITSVPGSNYCWGVQCLTFVRKTGRLRVADE